MSDGFGSARGFAACALLVLSGCATQADLQLAKQQSEGTRSLIADTQASVTSMRQELDQLRGEVEQMKFQHGQGGGETERLTSRLAALESRMASMEQMGSGYGSVSGAGPGMDPGATGGTEPGPAAPAGGPEIGPIAANAPPDYREGVELLRSGDAQAAVQKFREYLRKSPKSEISDDAQYWIGESYYSLRDFNRAILEFNEVLLRYPKGDKVPAALLRQAFAFAELGDKVDARLVLQKLVSEHGSSPEAERGRQKLADLAS